MLPGTIGDFAFQAANGLIAGIEAMLNGVATRINNFIGGINAALAMLPEWAVGEGGAQIGLLDPFNLGRINNPFEGGASAAGAAAADAFATAFDQTYVRSPNCSAISQMRRLRRPPDIWTQRENSPPPRSRRWKAGRP